jgi:HK97 family phage major capsid protein
MKKIALLGAANLAVAATMLARDGEALPAEQLTRELAFEVRAETINEEARTVELSFSSEEPYQRWWGTEVLDHKSASVRLGRLNAGGALLMDHNTRDQVGVVERAWIKGRKAYAVVRFGRSARAEEVFQDVKDGIRKLVSVGYRIHELVLEKAKDGAETYRATDWEPYEISLVAVPADPSVGVGRDGEPAGFDPRTLLQTETEEEDDMSGFRNAGGGAAPAAVATAATATPVIETREAGSPVIPAAPAGPTADEVRREERSRIANIRAMGERLNCAELAETAITEGRSLEQFISDYQARAGNASQIRTAENPEIGLTQREARNFSFIRMLNALANPNDRAAQDAAGFELEASNAARARSGREHRGNATVPVDVIRTALLEGQRDLTVGTAADGGNTVSTDLMASAFIDLLRNQLALNQMGIRMMADLNGNLAIPRQTGGATAYWVAESGVPTESQQSFGQVPLTPKTVGAFTDISRRLLLQSSIDVEAFVRSDLALVLALAIDAAGINGTGASNQPRGILNTAGIGSVIGGTNGAALSYGHIVDLETQAATANAAIGNLGYLINAKTRGHAKKTTKFGSSTEATIWDGGNEPLNGYRTGVSNQVPGNLTKGSSSGVCSAVIFGNWSDLILGMWSGLDLMVNQYALADQGAVRVHAFQDVDFAVRNAASFAAMVDALTPAT